MVAALEDAELLLQRKEELALRSHILRRAEEQEAARPQGKMEHRQGAD